MSTFRMGTTWRNIGEVSVITYGMSRPGHYCALLEAVTRVSPVVY